MYYVLATYPDPYPPNFTDYINTDSVRSAIGAETNWTESSSEIYANFAITGDWMKNSAPYLERVINAGVRTSLYNGDVVSAESTKAFLVLIQDFRIIFAITWVSKRWCVPLCLGLRRSSPELLFPD